MLTEQDFINAGYRKFIGYTGMLYAAYGLQKRFDDKYGKKYFITVSVYDWRKYPDCKYDFAFAPSSQFCIKDSVTMNVDFILREETTIEEIEKHFESIWSNMNCEYYERFDE